MIRKYLLPTLALVGIILGIYVAIEGSITLKPARPVASPAQAPYKDFVAGAGIIEASTENISIGTTVPGIVARIYAGVGSKVKAGAPLFTIDDRSQAAQVALLQAVVNVADAQLTDARDSLAFDEHLVASGAVTQEETTKRRHGVIIAEAQLRQAGAQLVSANTVLEEMTVRAPVDGQVLQIKVRPGEYAPTGVLATPLILFGNVDVLHLRVNVDENDAWRVKPGAAAQGSLRGSKDTTTALTFVRFEPYVIPKTSLTGDSTERVDTRVLQVIYSFDRGDRQIFVGQQMDVFVDNAPVQKAPPPAPEVRL
ncbi:MAG: hypothetical protein JWO94_1319 [Verrucomicrobiaceae bacterium]|nr:hypothetical protein [Verrucomicrobiaceae bacterium]